jgi:hypothetical protein
VRATRLDQEKYSTAGALAGAVDSSPRIIHVRVDLLRLKAYAYYVVRYSTDFAGLKAHL